MSKKSIILSSAGLKNLVHDTNYYEDFKFIFGEHEITIPRVFAEFISPYVSQIHLIDPTIESVSFFNKTEKNNENDTYSNNLSKETISIFERISKGEKAEIDDKEIYQLQIISILIQNEELFNALEKLYDKDKKKRSQTRT